MSAFTDLLKPKTFPGQDRGRSLWREVFGNAESQASATDKESGSSSRYKPVRGGSYGRSMVSSDAAFKRLLQAVRSMAPGGWSDDRWEQTKHFVGIAYVAIHRQNELMSQAEFQVYRKDSNHPDGKRPVHDGEEGYDLVRLLEKPNADDCFGDLMAQWNLQMDLTGMALTWMVPNKLGTPFELYVIPTATAIPQPAVNPDYPDGYYRIQPVYPYGPFSSYPTPASAVGAPIPAQWMLRFKYPHPLLRYDGYSPLTAMRLHLDEIESMDRSRWYTMKRSMKPSAVVQMDGVEGAEPWIEAELERIRADFEMSQQGPENHGNLLCAPPGGKIEPWGPNPVDMDYQGGWEQLVSFALGGLGITKPAAGMIEDSSYSTLFATLKQLYWLTLDPKASRIGSKLTRHLAPFFGDDLIVEVRCKRIDDHEVKGAALDRLMGGFAITKGELRKELELPLWGDQRDDEIAGIPPPPPAPPGGMMPPGQGGMVDPSQVTGADALPPEMMGGQGPPPDQETQEIEAGRPNPGTLNQGSLGPRMKSLYQAIRDSLGRNGNGRH